MSVQPDQFANYSREELIDEIKRLKKHKKFGLVWEKKKENVVEEFKTTLPYLKENQERRLELAKDEPTNLLIEGDNFDSLSILLSQYAGKVDVIYIDPPYNTGNRDFTYNDTYVDDEDAFRHSKWLSFIQRRLEFAQELLSDKTGIICISIDDHELGKLELLCDEILGPENFIGCAPRKSRGSATTKGNAELQTLGDYLLIYAKNKSCLTLQKKIVGEKKYPLNDERGSFYIVPLQDNGPHGTREARPNLWYPIYVLADGSLSYDEPTNYVQKILPKEHQHKEGCWMWSKKKFDSDKQDLYVKDDRIYIKHYLVEGEDQNKYQYERLWLDNFQNAKGTRALSDVMGKTSTFSNPKPIELVQYCIKLCSNKSALILDFFAGSGTTGQAVLELNKEDGGHRQFILCTNNENQIAEEVTYQRLKTVITGKRADGSKYSDGIPANLRYYKVEKIARADSNDANRQNFAKYCEDIICVGENTYNQLYADEDFALYQNDKQITAIIQDAFNLEQIFEEIKANNPNNIPVKAYTFSYSRYDYEDELPENLNFPVEFVAFPEGILQTYNQIIKDEERGDL